MSADSKYGFDFTYFHKILLSAFIITDGRFYGKQKRTPTMESMTRDLDVSGLSKEVSELRNAGLVVKIGRSTEGGFAYDINYDLIDAAELIITKEEYLANHPYKSRSAEDEKRRIKHEEYKKAEKERESERQFIQQRIRDKIEREARDCIDKQKEKAYKVLKKWESLDDSSEFCSGYNSSSKIFNDVLLLACAQSDSWFLENGDPWCDLSVSEEISNRFGLLVRTFIYRCQDACLIDEETLRERDRFNQYTKNALIDELSNYWNVGVGLKEKRSPLDSMKIFFHSCIVNGEWRFYHSERNFKDEIEQKRIELEERTRKFMEQSNSNVISFADFKKKRA